MAKQIEAIIPLLRCPYCEHLLSITERFFFTGEGSISGVVSCACDAYPLLHGILYLKKDPTRLNQQVISELRHGNGLKAVRRLIEDRRWIRWTYILLEIPLIRKISSYLSFLSLLSVLSPGQKPWYTYLRNRNRRATYMLSLLTLSSMKKTDVLVDVGCGTGNFLAKASELHIRSLIGIDTSFNLLYLARNFVVKPSVLLICCDVNLGLPFNSSSLTAITCNDCFMYFVKKKYVVEEITRVLTTSGRGFLTHVHNRNVENLGQGYAITPKEMMAISGKLHMLLTADTQLYASTVSGKITYQLSVSAEQQRTSPSFSYLLHKGRERSVNETKVRKEILDHIRNVAVDFTEDEALKGSTIV